MFVRTKNAIYNVKKITKYQDQIICLLNTKASYINVILYNNEIIAKSRKLTDLFDECIQYIPTMYSTPYTNELHNIELTIGHIEANNGKVYGAIWVDTDTQPTLKSVAELKNGKWVLL